ncbi:MAG: biosynthetic-type acetolactate synthase large subunit [Treponema sp.]|nr:biosynthetic-type acetolactate synthase large subunit [Treponema sp.]
MRKTGAEIIVKLLEMEGITTVAGIPGGSILPLYDELNRSSIRHILVRQEQAGGFIAQGMARSTGRPAVCLATSGPGAMNLLTAVADARSDSVPIIAITGQVNTSLIGTDAFQEADTFGLSFPITKHSVMVKSPEELLKAVPEAFKIAMNGRPGPVLIDVPRDVQCAVCEFDEWPDITAVNLHDIRFHTPPSEYAARMDKITDALVLSRKPVLYCGGGCNTEAASQELLKFLRSYRLPVVSSLMGLGCIPESSGMYAGMVGMHGSYAANAAMHEADLVVAAGVRFDDRATGVVSKFCPKAKIVHIDVDAAEVNKIVSADISLVADVESVFPILVQLAAEKQEKFASAWQNAEARAVWLEKIMNIRRENSSTECGRPADVKSVNPREFIASIPSLAGKAGTAGGSLIVTTDVGEHQMWAAQYYPVEKPRTFLTSGSLGTMGFGLPAAIGAALANPDRRIVCFSGDGSILMNIQELATLAELNLAVTVIVFENGTLGMVYQQQKYLFNKNYSACVFSAQPDLVTVARGFGIDAADTADDDRWYEKAFAPDRKKKPFFVRVKINREEDVLPFVPGGKANIDAIK